MYVFIELHNMHIFKGFQIPENCFCGPVNPGPVWKNAEGKNKPTEYVFHRLMLYL